MSFTRNTVFIFLVLFFYFFTAGPVSALTEKQYMARINELAKKKQEQELKKTAQNFFRQYPKSNYIPDVRLVLADNEQNTDKAVQQYKILVDKYRYYKKRDTAQHRICEILYLKSKWKELKIESQKGIRLFNNSGYAVKFHFFLAKALIYLEEYDNAKKVCAEITRMDHTYENLSNALLLLSFINKNIYGMSRSYLYSLNEIISGFNNSDNMPAALYLLGHYYKSRRDYNKAFSAFLDITQRYPKSPEASFSKKELALLEKYKPVKTDYIPDQKSIRETDKIDIQPELDIEENKESKTNIQYSVSLGKFGTIKHAREIKNLISKDFQPVEIAELRNGFIIYAGRFTRIDSAIRIRIRLAEEFGLNGTVVKLIKDKNRLYIYEE